MVINRLILGTLILLAGVLPEGTAQEVKPGSPVEFQQHRFAELVLLDDQNRILQEFATLDSDNRDAAVRCLVELGQWDLIKDHECWERDPQLRKIKPACWARHEWLHGNLRSALTWVEKIEQPAERATMRAACEAELENPYRTALRQVDNWLQSIAFRDDNGNIRYPVSTDRPSEHVSNLYHGLAGIAAFYFQMQKQFNEPLYQFRLRQIHRSLAFDLAQSDPEDDIGLFTGSTGIAMTLIKQQSRLDPDLHRQVIETLTARLADGAALPTTDIISGKAGIGLFLLNDDASQVRFDSLALAIKLGDQLLEVGKPVESDSGQPGMMWEMVPGYQREMPNYSHGTAGVCHFLIELQKAIQSRQDDDSWQVMHPVLKSCDGRFREAALAGARYLASLDTSHGQVGWIPHHLPGGEQLFYLGWCHGPPGTCQLANALAADASSASWQSYSRAATDSLVKQALHTNRTDGFWENVGICCGSAGVGSFLIDQSRMFKEPEYAREAKRIANDILARGTRSITDDGLPVLWWESAEHRVRPDLVQSQTGLMQGAAGIGLFLLQMDAYERGQPGFGVFGDVFR